MNQNDILELFQKTEALLSGHFLLSSGRHSDRYLQAARVLQHPEYGLRLGRELAGLFRNEGVSVVIGPALGAVVIAFTVAAGLADCRSVFAERQDGRFALRRGFQLRAEDRALIVEDVITTGGSTREIIELARSCRTTIVGVGAIAERSEEPVEFGVPKKVLLNLPLITYAAGECPFCRKGIPAVKPGSRTQSPETIG